MFGGATAYLPIMVLLNAKETKKLIRAAAKRMRSYVGIRNSWFLKNKKDINFNLMVNDIFSEAQKMIE